MARASAHVIGASQVRLASLTHIHLSRSPAPTADEANGNKNGFHKYPSSRKKREKAVRKTLELPAAPQPAAPVEEAVPVPVATVAIQVLDSNGAALSLEAIVHA